MIAQALLDVVFWAGIFISAVAVVLAGTCVFMYVVDWWIDRWVERQPLEDPDYVDDRQPYDVEAETGDGIVVHDFLRALASVPEVEHPGRRHASGVTIPEEQL